MKDKEPQAPAPERAAMDGEQLPEWLGDKLKEMFSTVTSEPVPDDLLALLRKLEEKEKAKQNDNQGSR
jgi:hypothetical protein